MILSLAAASALADQCAWVSKTEAMAATEQLKPGSEWVALCEPCGDTRPVPSKVGLATAAPVEGGKFWEVSIDGKPVDLAYTYVHAPGDPTGFTNLAKLVQCPATGVTRRLPWPPTTDHADRLRSWFGTYEKPLVRLKITQYFDDPNGLAIQIDTPTEHPSQAATVEVLSYADIDADPVLFSTALGSCRIRIAKVQGGVELRPEPACGGLFDAVAGTYAKVGP